MYLILCVTTLSMSLGSCELSDDGENFHYEPLQITSVELPESFDLYDVYDIKVTLLRPDDCTIIDGFNVKKPALTTRNIAAIGIILERDDCKTLDQEIEDSFRFEVIYDKPYLFRFYTGDDENGEAQYLEVEVPVN
ncbi:MAG: hypothetical protein COC08_08110 [Maribacter sp.]|nr:MAG: hypothetical protein COC08_08110 [Maribacter sp.]